MKRLSWLVAAIAIFVLSSYRIAKAKEKEVEQNLKSMNIIKPATQPSNPGPADYFTGSVRVTPLVAGESPSCLTCGSVAFQAGARSAWHTHPKGQLLIVTEGEGLIQEWGKPVRKIQKGDVIWTPPDVKHWHGAAPASAMTHTAVTEMKDGKNVNWMEKVTDDEYQKTPQ